MPVARMAPPRRHLREGGADSSSDESDTTAPAPAADEEDESAADGFSPAQRDAIARPDRHSADELEALALPEMARGADSLSEAGKAKCVEAMNSIVKEYICPITHEMPIAPVMAKDGVVYERAAIERWFETKEGDPTSPSTGAVISTELIPAPQIRNTIEALVKSGAIDGLEVATAWKQKLADETKVKELLAKAEGGDGEAMWSLGRWYGQGINGLAEDEAQARSWYERSAAARNPKGMGSFALCLLNGWGGPEDNAFGLVNVAQAAELGSSLSAYSLGWAFFHGNLGLPEDPVRARYWLKKVVDGECEYKHLNDAGLAEAAEWLRELDGQTDALEE